MKKFQLIAFTLVIALAGVFTSCGKDEILDPNPTINFKGGSTYSASDVSIKAGESILIT